jgi:hypothetical protein
LARHLEAEETVSGPINHEEVVIARGACSGAVLLLHTSSFVFWMKKAALTANLASTKQKSGSYSVELATI